MDDVDLQLNFTMCFDHFQHNELTKDDYKTPLGGSKDNSPNDSESIEVVETPSNHFKGPLQESTISSASNNTDICVLDSHYASDDLHFLPDDDLDIKALESEEGDEVFIRDASDDNEEFTLLRKPVKKSRRICKCEESTEILRMTSTDYSKKQPTYSGTDSDVEVLMSEEVGDTDWSSGKIEKSVTLENALDIKDERDDCALANREPTVSDLSCTDFGSSIESTYDRAQLLQIIQQQEYRIQALEATVERYQKAQQRLFEHVDALRIELSEIRITDHVTATEPEPKIHNLD